MLSFTKKEQIVILLLSSIIIVILGFEFLGKTDEIEIIKGESNTIVEESIVTSELEVEKVEPTIIMVHISGEVNNPGIVTLNEGERLIDAVKKLGGHTEEADLSRINLARKVVDEEKIHIPKIGEEIKEELADSVNKIETITNVIGKININTANLSQLESLPGIGRVKAGSIIKYREENKFNSIEDLTKVKGIGSKTFEGIKELITVKWKEWLKWQLKKG